MTVNSHAHPQPAPDPQAVFWTTQNRDDQESQLDFESAFMLRCFLFDVFANAHSWPELLTQLRSKGFRLVFQNNRLTLINSDTSVAVATSRFLGFSFTTLAKCLGKPHVRANSGEIIAM